jgi:hypothetical protein
MKKILLLAGLFFVIQSTVTAQLEEDTDNVLFTAILEGAFNIEVVDGNNQTAYFLSADDYNIGVSETVGVPGIEPGHSTITMEATGNWNMKIRAADFMPTTGTGSIPISNLGVWAEATGIHQFGVEVTCPNTSAATALGLMNTDQTLIDLNPGNSNTGNPADNEFVLNWLMGTMQGSMNPVSMFTQLANGVFSKGTFTTTVILTMTELP